MTFHLFGGWRVDSGFTHDRDATAHDVLRYETEELDNDLGLKEWAWSLTEDRPATDLIWICLKREDALRYGPDPEYLPMPQGSIILSNDDGDGGFLVLKGNLGFGPK